MRSGTAGSRTGENKKQTHAQCAAFEYRYMSKQDTIIDNLIETLKDGQEGFKQAAESVKDPELKSLFNEYSRQRAQFISELRSQAQNPEERESKPTGSAAGALHRGWINLKSALTAGDDHAILAECERGEDSAVEEYRKALEDGLSAPVRQIVSRQYAQIKEAHDRIKSLRDATKRT
jgi:uncharacterized protein (TIGR02284 family)